LATVDEVIARIEKGIDPREMVVPMMRAMDVLITEQMTFPPQPDRMRSGHLNTWVREVGQLPTSAFMTNAGTRRKRPITGVVLRESEKMLEKWKTAPVIVGISEGALIGRAVNAASYSGYVQGDARQPFHKVTGWLTTDEAFVKHGDKIVVQFVHEIVRNLQGG
jgi:hypothetical protein